MICRASRAVAFAAVAFSTYSASAGELARYELTQPHMGVPFTLLFYAADDDSANRAAHEAFARVKQLNKILSDYDPDSELSRLSGTSGSGKKVPLGEDLWTVLSLAQTRSRQTDGAFDVTVGPVVKLWRRARRTKALPSPDRLAAARAAVGFEHLRLFEEGRLAELVRPGMRLDLGGIAKGYAADEALEVLRGHGIKRALVDASGDMALGDAPPDREGWRVGIAPLEPQAPPSRFFTLRNCGVATSGDAWQYVEIEGVRYSHIIDPKTGLGLTTRSSVTVIAPSATAADSLASSLSVLGPQQGMKLIDGFNHTEAVVVTDESGQVQTYTSTQLEGL